MAKKQNNKSSTGKKILKSVLETLKFHLTGTGGETAKPRELPIIKSRPGSITPEYLAKIRKERAEIEKKLNARYDV